MEVNVVYLSVDYYVVGDDSMVVVGGMTLGTHGIRHGPHHQGMV